MDFYLVLIGSLLRATEFWSAIGGAVVGGLIADFAQVRALREGRAQRKEDREQTRKTLARSMLFKMIKIHSNFYDLRQYFEECFAEGARDAEKLQPWQFVRPAVNPPDRVHFSSDEMGMLLASKNDDLFNELLYMDSHHNGLLGAVAIMDAKRAALTDLIPPDAGEGPVFSSGLDEAQNLALRPKMFEVNTLALHLRTAIGEANRRSLDALHRLRDLFRERLGLTYKMEFEG